MLNAVLLDLYLHVKIVVKGFPIGLAGEMPLIFFKKKCSGLS